MQRTIGRWLIACTKTVPKHFVFEALGLTVSEKQIPQIVANVGVDRIIYSIFQRFNLEWKTRALRVLTQAA